MRQLTDNLYSITKRSLADFLIIIESWDSETRNVIFKYISKFFPDVWNDVQLINIKKILSHTEKNVEYWRDKLLLVDMCLQDPIDFKKFSKLPLLSRSLIKELGNNIFLARGVAENRRLLAHTSGSTGEPLVFYQDTKELLKRKLNILYGLLIQGIQFRYPAFISGLDTHVYLESLGKKYSDIRDEKNRVNILYPMLEQLKPEVLFCTPSYLKMFYKCLEKDKKTFSFKIIYCAGESMYEEDREIFSLAFRSKISMWYGTRETGPIAVECIYKKYHLIPWSNYVEVVDSTGTPVHSGEGDILVTSFGNYVMPFIRYKTGDRGKISTGNCDCGSKIPILKLTGREPIIIKTPGGNSFAISELGSVVASKFATTILQFQLVEEKAGKYTFRFVPTDKYVPGLNVSLLNTLYEIAGPEAIIILEKVHIISPNESGKAPTFLSKNKNED